MFDRVVALYRALDQPEVEDGVYEYAGPVDNTVLALIQEVKGLPRHFGYFETEKISGNYVDLEFRLPVSEHGAFYHDITEMVRESPSLGKGIVPENFYLLSENWSPEDCESNTDFQRLVVVCNLVNWLGDLAVGVDKDSSHYFNSLFFAVPSTEYSAPKSFVFKTEVTVDALEVRLRHVGLVKALVSEKNEGVLHIEERKMIFQLSIADILDQAPRGSDHFSFLLKNWDKLLNGYWKNLQSYVYGFSFDKIRLEVAKAEVDYSSKLSASLGDVAGKLLALPVSLISLPLLNKASSLFEFFVVSLGMLTVTFILFCLLLNQWLQVKRLRSSFNIVFDQFRDKLETYPRSLKDMLGRTLSQVDTQGKVLSVTLIAFCVASFIPAASIFLIYDEDKYKLLEAAGSLTSSLSLYFSSLIDSLSAAVPGA